MGIRQYLHSAIIVLLLQAAALLGPLGTVAAAAALSPEQTAAYHAKLTQAETTQESLSRQAACLDGYLAELEARSKQQELLLAAARRREAQLQSQVSSGSETVRLLEMEAAADLDKFEAARRDFERARQEQQEQLHRLNECRKWMTFLSALCDAGDRAVKDLGWMRDAEADMRVTGDRLRQAENRLNGARNQVVQSEIALSQARQEAAANRQAIEQSESLISSVKATSSKIHIKVQDYNILVGTFRSTLHEAAEIDTSDVRMRTVDRLSSELDALVSATPAFIASAEGDLPDEAKQKCSL